MIVPPAIDPNFLDDPYDWDISIRGFEWGREMLATKAYAPYIKKEHMPGAHVRLSAGREAMSDELQALCFVAGANSMFYGEKLLTTGNPDVERDQQLFARLGLKPEGRAGDVPDLGA